jgi:transposase
MSGFRQPETRREQIVLWAERLDEAVPADHSVRLFDQLLRAEAFAATFKDWEAEYNLTEGQPPYHPRDLTAVYLYGQMNRLRSSRQLEAACGNRVDVIWLMSGQRPDHATIAGFVAKHQVRLRQIHRDVLGVAQAAGLLKLHHAAYDGTKVAADAGKKSVRTAAQIAAEAQDLEARVTAMEKEWAENERREQTLLGDELTQVPNESEPQPRRLARLKERQARLQRALVNIQRRAAVATGTVVPKPIASVTDPDSRVMPNKEGGSRPNYNAQVGVDADSGLIVAAEVCDEAEDSTQLVPLLEQTRATLAAQPEEVSADGGYATGSNLAELEQRHIQGYVPCGADATPAAVPVSAAEWATLPKAAEGRIPKDVFRYDPVADEYVCPMGRKLKYHHQERVARRSGTRMRRHYVCRACPQCPHQRECCENPVRGRTIKRDQYDEQRERMRSWMATAAGQSGYQLRKETVERRFGLIKHVLGVRRFMRRGIEAVRTEWMLICAAVNVAVLLKRWKEVQAVL